MKAAGIEFCIPVSANDPLSFPLRLYLVNECLINGLKIQLIIMLKNLALVSFLRVLGTAAASCLWAEFCPWVGSAAPRRGGERSRIAIKMTRLDSFALSWEREIAGVKQHRKRKLDFLREINLKIPF